MSRSYGALEALDDPLLPKLDTSLTDSLQHTKKYERSLILPRAVIAFTFAIAATVLVVMADIMQPSLLNSNQSKNYLDKKSSSSGIVLAISSVTNDYGLYNSNSMMPYPFLLDSFLVEPYKETTVVLDGTTSGCSYDWSFTKVTDGKIKSNGTNKDGNIIVTLSLVGEYNLAVLEDCGSDSSEEFNMSVWVKYVRRELTTLNDVDREEFLDAFHTLWTVSTVDGMTLYGDRYKSLYYLAILHNDGGGNTRCDEFHGGLGFLNNHMYLSAFLEQSLQMINPKVALHYMEYTKYFSGSSFEDRKFIMLHINQDFCIVRYEVYQILLRG
jgi:hypothetical protein